MSTNPRVISSRVLDDVFSKGAYGGIALSEALEKNPKLDRSGRAFVTESVNGALRNLKLLDYVVADFSKTPLRKIKPAILNILRLSAYEIMFMNTADYAACSEAVNTAKARGLGGLSGFVNGVSRNIARHKDKIVFPDEKNAPVSYLSIVYSHPVWLVEKWLRDYGYGFTKELLIKNNEPPDVSVCANTLRISADALADELIKEGVSSERSEYAENALILKNPGSIKKLECFKKGFFHVQDIASQIAAELLTPPKGGVIADLCAAPGGKSFRAAYLMENSGKIYASDIHAHKTKLISDGAKRLGINIIETRTRDAAITAPELVGKADAVIIDAPCSGLGVLRKKPDIKLNRCEEDIAILQKAQRNILRAAAAYVKPGGSLLYSTCTLANEENEQNADWFIDNFEFEPADIAPILRVNLKDAVRNKRLTLFPHIHGTDGFFICKFTKMR